MTHKTVVRTMREKSTLLTTSPFVSLDGFRCVPVLIGEFKSKDLGGVWTEDKVPTPIPLPSSEDPVLRGSRPRSQRCPSPRGG